MCVNWSPIQGWGIIGFEKILPAVPQRPAARGENSLQKKSTKIYIDFLKAAEFAVGLRCWAWKLVKVTLRVEKFGELFLAHRCYDDE